MAIRRGRRQLRSQQELVLLQLLVDLLDHVRQVHPLRHLLVDWIVPRTAVLEVCIVLVQVDAACIFAAAKSALIFLASAGRRIRRLKVGYRSHRVIHIEA